MSEALAGLAALAFMRGHYEQVRSYCEESLALLRAEGDQWNVAQPLFILAAEAYASGESSRAWTFAEECLAVYSAAGDRVNAVHPALLLAQLAFDRGDFTAARSRYDYCLLMIREADAKWYAAPYLQGLGMVTAAQGQLEWAAQLWGAADAFQETTFVLLAALVHSTYERAVARVRAQLGEAVFAAAWARGRTMTLEQVLAQEEVTLLSPPLAPEPSQTQPATAPTESAGYPAGLTAREVEVLRLVAQGLTTAQIAERLIVSPHTVHAHISSIHSKLGVNSRSAATRFAFEQKLI